MTIRTFPGTATQIVLLGPAPQGRFSEIWRHGASGRPHARMASVNAGDPRLYVGRGTINLAFSAEIDSPGDYQALHARALMAARAGRGMSTGYGATDPVRLIMVARGDGDAASGAAAAGTVFLDIFADGGQPHGVVDNHAMAYLVPPYGPDYADEAGFLAAVQTSALRIVTLISDYNAAPGGLDPITDLRLCLFSGGQFIRPGTGADQVAQAIHAGTAAGLLAGKSGIGLVEFESGTGEFAAI